MKRFSQRNAFGSLAELNITPLLDLAFVLLIIFIITTPLIEQGIELSLPSAAPSRSESDRPAVRAVSVDRAGTIYFDKKPMSLPRLQQALADWKRTQPNAAVVVRADKDLRYQKLMDVFDTIKRAGISKMALVNNPKATSRGR